MEGKATFTLTNAKTGRTVRQFTEHNLVTDAVKRILAPPGYAIMNSFNWSGFLSEALPLYKTLFGGIMLLGNNITESAGNVMLPPGYVPVATAGDAYSGACTTRGSLNLNESYETENGYHFTWDFGTDKANGTICCAALTSRIFGNTGFGNDENTGSLILNPDTLSMTSPRSKFCMGSGQYICTIGERSHIYYKLNSDKTIKLSVVKTVNPDSLGINDSGSLSSVLQPDFTIDVTLPIDISDGMSPFYDSTNSTLYFFSKAALSDGVTISCAGIKLTDYSVVSAGTWLFSQEHRNIGVAAYFKGLLYAGDNFGLYSMDNTNNLTTLSDDGCNNEGWFFVVNGTLYVAYYSGKCKAIQNGSVYKLPIISYYGLGSSTDISAPYYPGYVMEFPRNTSVGLNQDPFLCLATNYLATINNLSEPLEKTNEHTLKITYDITN